MRQGRGAISLGQPIRDVEPCRRRFRVSYGDEEAEAPALVIATGGPSIPKMGATGFAYDLARKFGLKVVEPRPALVPLTLGGDEVLFRAVRRRHRGRRPRRQDRVPRGGLFTHKGLSGPAILQSPPTGARRADRHRLPAGAGAGWLLEAKRKPAALHFHTLLGELLPAGWPRRWPSGSGCGASSPTCPTGSSTKRSGGWPTGASPERHRRLRQGRSDGRRHQHRRAVSQTMEARQGAGPLRDRRGGGRHRLARRLQFPMGLGERLGGGAGALARVPLG
jgi:hypothetical protein